MVLNIILRDNLNIRLSLDKMSEIKRERGFFHDKLYLPLTKLRNSPAFSLSPLKLLVCDGGIGRGVRFGQSCVHVDAISETNGAGLKYNRIFLYRIIYERMWHADGLYHDERELLWIRFTCTGNFVVICKVYRRYIVYLDPKYR